MSKKSVQQFLTTVTSKKITMNWKLFYYCKPGADIGSRLPQAGSQFSWNLSTLDCREEGKAEWTKIPVPFENVFTHYVYLKGLRHAICYLFQSWNVFRINWIPKIMLQFCYLRLYLGNESVLWRLLRRMARMDMDSNLITLGQFYPVLMMWLQKSPKNLIWSVLPGETCFFITLQEHFVYELRH